MSSEIFGWIEIRENLDEIWVAAVKISTPLLRHGDKIMETFLFSARTVYEDALVGRRGIPDDVSPEFKELNTIEEGGMHSWICWHELEHLVWEERQVETKDPYTEKYLMVEPDFKVVLTGGWELIFALMKTLSEFHGAERVRLVVGFS